MSPANLSVTPGTVAPNVPATVTGSGMPTRVRLYQDGLTSASETIYTASGGTFTVGTKPTVNLGAHSMVAKDDNDAQVGPTISWTVANAAPPVPAGLASGAITLQQAIDQAAAGSTFGVPDRVYPESLIIAKNLTLVAVGTGAIVDAAGKSFALESRAVVEVDGINFRNAANPVQTGAVRVQSGKTLIVRGGSVSYCGGGGIGFGGGVSCIADDVEVHHNGQLGFHIGGSGANNTVQNCEIHHNNTGGNDPLWEAGGLKATGQTNLLLVGNDVHDNIGLGLWDDIYCHGTIWRANRIHGNTYSGIMAEVGYDGVIEDNVVYHNGFSDTRNQWWGANILISSSTRVTCRRNTVYDGQSQIAIVGQTRNDWPAVKPYTGALDTNTVVGLSGQDLIGLMNWDNTSGWSWSQTGTKYWSASGKTATGTAMTTAQKDAALAAVGLP